MMGSQSVEGLHGSGSLQQTRSPRGGTTTDTGLEFVGSVSADIKALKAEMQGIQESLARLGRDIGQESRQRGGDLASLQASFLGELTAQISSVRTDFTCQHNSFQDMTKKWAGALGQEIVALKPRVDEVERAIPLRVQAQMDTDERVNRLEQANLLLKRDISEVDSQYRSAVAAVEATIVKNREDAESEVRQVQQRFHQEIRALGEQIESVSSQQEVTKKKLTQSVETLSTKIDGVEQFAQTRAKASDVQALEIRVHDTIERGLKTLSEEVSRKEAITTVKALSDRLTTVTMDVHANQVKAAAEDEALGKRIEQVDRALGKLGRQVSDDRDRMNEGLCSLEKVVQTKAGKVEVECLPPRIAAVEVQIPPIMPEVATKANYNDVRKIQERMLAIEKVFPSKADAAELPKLHLAVAEHHAKHAAVVSRAQEHDNKLERFHSVETEHRARLEVVEQRERDLHNMISSKAEAEHVLTKEGCTMLLGDYYRREEIDAIMTRVWWRVGDTAKTTPRPPMR